MRKLITGVLCALPLAALAGSDYIRSVEQKLSSLGYAAGEVDGEFDAQLERAIRAFQARHAMTVDGHLTHETYDAIMRADASDNVPAGMSTSPAPAATGQMPPRLPPVDVPPPASSPPPSAAPACAPPQPIEPMSMEKPRPAPPPPLAPMSRLPPVYSPEPSHEAPRVRRVGFFLDGGAEFGGDAVATVFFTDGSSQQIRGGQGVSIGAGLYARPAPTDRFDLDLTIGYKYTSSAASNADISLTRVVSALSARWWFVPGWWVSGGGVYHSGISFDSGGSTTPTGQSADLDFKNAFGGNVGIGWRWVGLTYTFIHYTDEFDNRYNASNGGLTISYWF